MNGEQQHDEGLDPATLRAGPSGADLPNVHQAMARAMSTVRAVGKWGKNTDQGYAFRSIDHFMSALNPAMANAGVHVVPKVLQRIVEDRTTRSGNRMRCVDLEVRFTFYGPAGDHVSATVWGEGADTADKATNKALTGAFKYAIMQAFMVPTQDLRDADADTPDIRTSEQRTPQQQPATAPSEQRQQQTTLHPAPEQVPDGVDPNTGEVTKPPGQAGPTVDDLAAKAWRVRSVDSLRTQVYDVAREAGLLQTVTAHPKDAGKRVPLAALITVRKAELLGAAKDDPREDPS